MNIFILAESLPFQSVYCFQATIEPLIIFVAGVVLAVRRWKKSTGYFKAGFICWLITFFGGALGLIFIFQDLLPLEALFMLSLATWPACGVWFAVWVLGFLDSNVFISK